MKKPTNAGMNNKKQREQNRREAPNVANIVDEITRFFGPVKVIAAEDFVTGKKFGKWPEDAKE